MDDLLGHLPMVVRVVAVDGLGYFDRRSIDYGPASYDSEKARMLVVVAGAGEHLGDFPLHSY
jgi:hypothetical protein